MSADDGGATTAVSVPKLGLSMAMIWARLVRACTSKVDDDETERLVNDSDVTLQARQHRHAYKSSGRGGLGNIKRIRPTDGLSDLVPTGGRELGVVIRPDRVYSVGRGGAGNIRTTTGGDLIRDQPTEAEYQVKLVREHAKSATIYSSGRGGAGNMFASHYRSQL